MEVEGRSGVGRDKHSICIPILSTVVFVVTTVPQTVTKKQQQKDTQTIEVVVESIRLFVAIEWYCYPQNTRELKSIEMSERIP